MEISYFKYLELKLLELIFVVSIGILLNNYVQDGCNLEHSILSQEIIIINNPRVNNPISLVKHCYKLQKLAFVLDMLFSNNFILLFFKRKEKDLSLDL